MQNRIFLDSDVIIPAIISNTGASYRLIDKGETYNLCISNYSKGEIEKVIKKLCLPKVKLENLLQKVKIHAVSEDKETLEEKYHEYVFDPYDAHIVEGAFPTTTTP